MLNPSEASWFVLVACMAAFVVTFQLVLVELVWRPMRRGEI